MGLLATRKEQTSMEKIGHFLFYLLFIFLFFFLIYYGYTQVGKLKKYNKNAIETTGTIEYISSDYKNVNISYIVNGAHYQLRLLENKDEKLQVGDSIKVYYDQTNPKEARRNLVSPNTGYFVMGFGFLFEFFLLLRFVQELRS